MANGIPEEDPILPPKANISKFATYTDRIKTNSTTTASTETMEKHLFTRKSSESTVIDNVHNNSKHKVLAQTTSEAQENHRLMRKQPESTPVTNIVKTSKRKVSEQEDIPESGQANEVKSFYNSYRSSQKVPTASKPAFKVSAFVSPTNQSANISFNTSMNTSSFDFSTKRSPFYRGGTTFGGASSFRESSSKRIKLSPVSSQFRTTRTNIKAKPLSAAKRNVVTSQTAKRILNTLGKMSSPVKDSKNISSSVFTKSKLSDMVKKQSKLVEKNSNSIAPPIKSLSNFKPVEIGKTFSSKVDTIKRFNKQSTNMENSLSFSPKTADTEPPPISKPVAAITTKSSISSGTLKMKREKTSAIHFSSNVNKDDEVVNTMPEITSVNVPLAITALPKFNFSNTSNTKKTTGTIFSPSVNVTPIPKVRDKTLFETKSTVSQFGLSTPKPESMQTVKPQPKLKETSKGGFAFSSPNVVEETAQSSFSGQSRKEFTFSSPFNLITDDTKKPVAELTESTTLPTSFAIKPSMINNKQTAEVSESKPTNPSLQSTQPISSFVIKPLKNLPKAAEDSWSCPTCMINNKQTDSKCVACCLLYTSPSPRDS